MNKTVATVWVVTKGDYSDYRILAIYDNQPDADKLAKALTDRYDAPEVEEWDVNTIPTRSFTTYRFKFASDGRLVSESKPWSMDECQLYEPPYVFPDTEVRDGLHQPTDVLLVTVHENNRDKAFKIATDERAKYLAEQEQL